MNQTQRSQGCGKPGHIGNIPDPGEGDGATQYCETCEEEARCGHFPARPDADMTLCWKCGVEIIHDPDIREECRTKGETVIVPIWRPLTRAEKLVKYETTRQLRDLFVSLHSSEFSRILFDRLHVIPEGATIIRLAESIMGRWIIVNGQDEFLAWSGAAWAPHRHGVPTGNQQICNFKTREEAKAYANERFPESSLGERIGEQGKLSGFDERRDFQK